MMKHALPPLVEVLNNESKEIMPIPPLPHLPSVTAERRKSATRRPSFPVVEEAENEESQSLQKSVTSLNKSMTSLSRIESSSEMDATEPNEATSIFDASLNCPIKHAPFNVRQLGFGNLFPLLITERKKEYPWFVANKFSQVTRLENAILDELYEKLDHIFQPLSLGKKKEEITRVLVSEFSDTDSKGATLFDKSLLEIMKLLEETKEADAANIHEESAAVEERKKKERMAEMQFTATTMLANTLLDQERFSSSISRKPIRLIMAQLQKRIETLKNSQDDWDEFEKKVGTFSIILAVYKKEDREKLLGTHDDLILKNKYLVRYRNPQIYLEEIEARASQHEVHSLDVRGRNEKMIKLRETKILASIKKKELALERKKNIKPLAKLSEWELLQRRWYLVISLASRLSMLRFYLECKHKARIHHQIYNRHAIVIQREWKLHKKHLRDILIAKSLEKIKRFALLNFQRVP